MGASRATNLLRRELEVLALTAILLSVKEPLRDVELEGVGDDSLQRLNFLFRQLAGALRQVDICLLADEVGESATNTANLGQREHDLDVQEQ